MKVVSLAIFFSSLLNFLFSQTLKQYQGDFKTNSETGIASYTYVENAAFERIFQGNFSFSSTNKLFKISGQFQNDKKNGMWQYFTNNFRPHYYADMGVKNISFNIYGKYSEGNMEGNWIFKRIVNLLNSEIVEENSIVNFKHNHLIGNFSFSFGYYRPGTTNRYVTIKGAFDDDGEKTGIWTVNFLSDGIKYQNISKYNGDILSFRLIRNISNGEILYKLENGVTSTNSTSSSDFYEALDVNVGINFWTNQDFRYPSYYGFYPDFEMYSYLGICKYNPIFEITKGSNIGEDRRLLR